jgi:peptidoglycan-associated lipoprotein
MNSILKNTLLCACALVLLVGCASKDVEYNENGPQGSMENKIDKVAVSDDNITTDKVDRLKIITNESVNSVQSDVDGKVVILESVHFAFDKYNISDEMRAVTVSNYAKIDETIESYSDLKIKLEGNCDEWGSDEYNYALGLKRAKATKDALIADGVDTNRIVMVSFGEANPICTEKNTDCWKMNRRVDYKLLP